MKFAPASSLGKLLSSAELEVVLHSSKLRLQLLGVVTIMSHLLFYAIWTLWIPQPYENPVVRLTLAFLGVLLLALATRDQPGSPVLQLYFSLLFWLQLPLFMIWMYWMNGCSAMWMATVASMLLIYYHLTDWRLATLGVVLGATLATAVAQLLLSELPSLPGEHGIVFAFAWGSSFVLGVSSANLRRERIRNSLTVIGIMAHELRTPLATLALIAGALRSEAPARDEAHAKRLEDLAGRIDKLTRAINHHIDLQMANARFTQQMGQLQALSARALVQKVVHDYPFDTSRARLCVEVILHEDFCFRGSERQFTQVLNNLIKNALHSLKAAQSRYSQGDLHLEIGRRGDIGRIQVSDRGVGINAQHMARIFEPFFSTASETGHGLGLAFCKQVLEAAQGQILVHSQPAMGASFTLQLPCVSDPPENDHEISSLSSA